MLKGHYHHILLGMIVLLGATCATSLLLRSKRSPAAARLCLPGAMVLLGAICGFSYLTIRESEWFLAIFFEEDTVFSSAFSEKGLALAVPGTSAGNVVRAIGQPIRKQRFCTEVYWYYSQPGLRHKNYRVRIVVFNESMIVARLIKGFYSD